MTEETENRKMADLQETVSRMKENAMRAGVEGLKVGVILTDMLHGAKTGVFDLEKLDAAEIAGFRECMQLAAEMLSELLPENPEA